MRELPRVCEQMIASQPKRKASDLVLRPSVYQSLDRFLRERKHDAELLKHGLSPRNKLLFWGPPGNGKTATAEAVAYELRVPFLRADCSHIVDAHLGGSEKNLREMFDSLKEPCVALLDECDTLLGDRNQDNGSCHRAYVSIVNYFIQRMDLLPTCVTFVAATNRRDALDPAVLRRFHADLEFAPPNTETMRVHKRRLVKKYPVLESIEAEVIEGITAPSHAELEARIEDLAREAVLISAGLR